MPTLRCAILFARDLPRLTAFYRDALELRVIAERPDWAELNAGGASLALHAIPEEIAARISIASPPRARTETPLKLAFAVEDLRAARDRAQRHGALMSEPTAWGACDGIDPEGNVFQLVQPERP